MWGMMMKIERVDHLSMNRLQPLLDASLGEGYDFIQRLWDEYQSGENRFDQGGAVLLSGLVDNEWIAIGGVHPDPYLKLPTVGRIRHVYVLPQFRRRGIATLLMRALIERGGERFDTLTLRTLTPHGDAFYKSLGFTDEPRYEQATHWMSIRISG